jgi:hypothetical protein
VEGGWYQGRRVRLKPALGVESRVRKSQTGTLVRRFQSQNILSRVVLFRSHEGVAGLPAGCTSDTRAEDVAVRPSFGVTNDAETLAFAVWTGQRWSAGGCVAHGGTVSRVSIDQPVLAAQTSG